MKAILVIDMPTDCVKCPLANGYCWNIFPAKGKADGCPLRLLPQELDYASDWEEVEISFRQGWNACLKEITE